ncbi:MAG: hypothetical protein J6I53_09110 [Treponema sp.]|nr:hypothetical protein [Treponema sp.]
MKKLLLVGFFLASASLFAQVNRGELEAGQSEAVQFENYVGTHKVIDSAAAIVGIGTALGNEVASDIENPLSVQPYAKYSVYHVVGGVEEQGLDADILFLNETAGVDHINNLRRIITGYLMAAYGYSNEEAQTLAIFITVYNAVYRGNLSNFSGKYKSSVLTYLTADAVGLSTNWEEWAGKTQIVIPLGEIAEGTASVETSVISDDKVIEALRAEDDKSVPTREKLTDIKEKEAGNASEKAKTAQKEAAQAKKDGDKTTAAASAKEANEQQQIADRKTEEVKAEREQIAKDKAEVKKEEAAKASAGQNQNYLTSLFVVDAKNRLYSLMTVDPDNGQIVKKSALRQIREKTIFPVANVSVQNDDGSKVNLPEAFLAVCGVNDSKSPIKLCLIDAVTLEIKKQCEETLSENSPLVQSGDTFYVIVAEGGKNYLASFDKELALKKKSDVAINGASPLNFYSEGILVTDDSGNPVLLSLPALASVWSSSAAGSNTRTSDAK